MKRRSTLLTVLSLVWLFGCGVENQHKTVEREGKGDVIRFNESDEEMNAAIRLAKANMKDFVKAFEAPKPNQSGFSVKYPFKQGEITEHMWVVDLTKDGDSLIGTLNNDPLDLTNYAYGQDVKIPISELSDWFYVENGVLVGGYTLKLMVKDYPPAKLRELEKELGFRFQ